MKKSFIFILMYFTSLSINALNTIDVFGTDPKTSEELIKNYGKEVVAVMTKIQKIVAHPPVKEELLKTSFDEKMRLIEEMKKNYGFPYVDFDTVFYYDNKKIYTTIEVVSKDNPARMQFIDKMEKYPSKESKHDLIEDMIKYQENWGQVMLSNQIDINEKECPVFHCLPGYSHPKLKKQFDLFTANAMKEKELIYKTINQDPNPHRRTAAVFLMGHFQDPREIISFLTKHVMDSNSEVRNAAMRVINLTMMKSKIHDMDILPIVKILDSPYDTDRNKALLLLLTVADTKKNKDLIIKYGKENLIALLHLKQPNNLDESHSLLKKISGKNYGPNDFKAWEQL